MQLGELCTRSVITCATQCSAADVARLMRQHHVGDLVVVEAVEDGQQPVGVVTDRDLVMQVMATGADPSTVSAADLMSPACTALSTEGVYDAVWHMRRKGCRRLPVVDSHNRLVGLLTLDDLTRFLAQELIDLSRIPQRQSELESARLTRVP